MRVDEYLSFLPDGAASYPDAKCKASVVRTFCTGLDVERLVSVLPPEAVALVRALPPDSFWVPEVWAQCVFLSARQMLMDSDDEYLVHAREKNRRLLSSSLYRAVFKLFSGRRVARLVGVGWGRFHQGSESKVMSQTARSVTIRLDYPAHLFCPLVLGALGTALEEALRVAGYNDIVSSAVDQGADFHVVRTAWSNEGDPAPR